MSQAMLNGAKNISELIIGSGLSSKLASTYRIIGDPLAPLYASLDGIESAEKVKVYL
jgi:hypothetical protein